MGQRREKLHYIVENIITKFKPELEVEVTLLEVLSTQSHYVMAGDTGVQVLYTDAELTGIKAEALEYLTKAGAKLAFFWGRLSFQRSLSEVMQMKF